MAGEYYSHTTFPSNGSTGSAADMRSELEEIEAGFNMLPTLAGNGNKLVVVNAGGTALESGNTLTSPAINGTVTTTGLTLPAFTGGAINGTTIPTSKTLVTTDDVAWMEKTTTYTAVSGQRILANTSAGAWTLTLPISASVGHYVSVIDAAGTFATNNLTIARNGLVIMGLTEDMTCSTNNAAFDLVYQGATYGWRLF